VQWTPDAATVITGSASGAFTRWAGTTFNYESVQQNCARAVRVLCWSHSGEWLLSADDSGEVLGWHGGVVKEGAFNAHKDVVRGLSMAPTGEPAPPPPPPPPPPRVAGHPWVCGASHPPLP